MVIKINGYYIKNLEVTDGMEHEAVFGDLYYKKDFICSFVDEGTGGGMVAEGLSDEHFRRLTGILDRQELLPSFCRDSKNFVVDVFVTNLLNLDMFVTQFKKDCEKKNIEEPVVSLAVEKKEKWNDIIWVGADSYPTAIAETKKKKNVVRLLGYTTITPKKRVVNFCL